MTPGKVSIVIPSYNHVDYVRSSIRSVLDQDYEDVELLVIDDGSTDGSRRVLEELAEESGFKLILQEHRGLAPTLNRALSLIEGEFYSMLSSDDLLMPEKTRILVDFLLANPEVGGAGGRHIAIDREGNKLGESLELEESIADFLEIFTASKPTPSAPTMMLRTACVREVGGYDESIGLEDMDMWLKLAYAGYKISTLPICLAYYRKHEENNYRDVEMMYRSLLATFGKYSHLPEWPNCKRRIQRNQFYNAARCDRALAEQIWREMEQKGLDWRLVRAWLQMRFAPANRPRG